MPGIRMIGRHRWRQVDSVLERALDLPAGERAAAIDTACADDPELRKQVLSLLAGEEEPDPLSPGVLLASAQGAHVLSELRAAAGPAPTTLEGESIGPYTLGSELGRGGMAVVYSAERTDGEFDQQVAIKLLFSGERSHEIIERFRRERSILAAFDHPNITRLLEGGVSPDGRPYFAMERVDGQPIDDYCRRQHLAFRPRLRLWLAVAEAVSYAHRRLLVHRDLKPSNILVTAAGKVKLLDFGIAKLLGDRGAGSPSLTRTGRRPMTPRYASPEQVSEHDITTATDVYQLGVVLYELLSGRSPYQVEEDSTVSWEDAIRHQQPSKPSQVLRRASRATAPTADETQRSGVVHPRDLAGDLDEIVLKALRKEPEERYGSVDAMREDVERFLSGLPVLARPATSWYRIRRFLLRHRGVMAAVLMATLLLTGLVAFHTHRLAGERDLARREARKAEQVTTFLTEVFRGGNPEITGRDDLSARDLLDRGAQRIDEELAAQPEVRSEVQSVIGQAYRALGLFEEAESIQKAALVTVRQLAGDRSEEAAEILNHLGALHEELGRYDRADELLREALAIRREVPRPDAVDVAKSLNNLGLLSRERGRFDEAQGYLEEAIAIKERVLGPDHPSVANSLDILASVFSRMNDYDRAVELSRRAVSIYDSSDVPDAPARANAIALASALTNLAIALRHTGDFEESRRGLERALEIKERAYGREHPRVAVTLNSLGGVMAALDDRDAARRLFERALTIYRQGYGPNHPRVATPLNNLGQLNMEGGDPAAARELFQEALRIRLASFGPEHPRVVQTRLRLAGTALEDGDSAAAEAQLAPALEVLRRQPEPDESLSEALLLLGGIFADTGRGEAAEPLLRESLELRIESLGRDDRETARVLVALGRCLYRLGRESEARDLLQEVVERFKESDPGLADQARSALPTSR